MSPFVRVVRLLSELPCQYCADRLSNQFAVPFTCFLLSKDHLPSNRQLLRVIMHARQRGRGLKRIVQPRPQIAIEEQLLP